MTGRGNCPALTGKTLHTEGQADLDIPGVEEDGLANLLGHLPALLLRHQLGKADGVKGHF